MPGGGLYRRVSYAAAAFGGEGAESIIQKRKTSSPRSKPDTGSNNADNVALDDPVKTAFCDVQAFSVWYWSDDGSFVPETMYLNAKDAGHTTTEPRLVVSLSSFEALSQAYVKVVEKEGIKAAALKEKEDLLAALRVGYYKELMHLRELLDAAREQMALASKRTLDDAELQRMQQFERMVKTTDVHYFNIVDYLEPELKAIMQEGVKSFNRDLMKEIFDLRDRLALHEGSEGEDGLVERVLTMLLGRGISPAKILKMVSDMIVDKQQSDDFHKELSRLLNLGPREDLGGGYARKARPSAAVTDYAAVAEDEMFYGKGRGGRESVKLEGLDKEDLLDQARQMKDEIARLKAEIRKLLMQLKESQQALASAKAQFEKDLAAAIEKCKKEMMAKMKGQRPSQINSGGGAGAAAAVGPPVVDAAAPPAAAAAAVATRPSQAAVGGVQYIREGTSDADAARLRELLAELDKLRQEYADLKAKADRREWELERKLKEAQALIAQLKGESGGSRTVGASLPQRQCSTCGTALQCLNPECVEYAGTRALEPSRGDDAPSSPIARARQGSNQPAARGGGEGWPPEGEHYSAAKRNTKLPGVELSQGLDRSGVDRSGNYSALTGKPMLLVEDELKHERELRIKYEIKNKELGVQIDDFKLYKKEKEREIAYLKRDLSVTEDKLEKLIEKDENDGVEDVQVFCNWLVKKYGSLDAGFRALDDDSSGGMSLTEFIGGLKQMGWLKIVGKRLYKLFDSQNTGQFTLSQLHEVYDKFVHGREDATLQNEIDEANALEAKEKEKKEALKEMRARAKRLEDDKTSLEEEVIKLQRKLKREDITLAAAATSDGRDAKAMERKMDSIQKAYESMKQERDETVSKMTAAMWKCRVAHMAQVKLGREAAVAKEELKKLEKKFDFFKTSMKRQKPGMAEALLAATEPNFGASAPTRPMQMTWSPGAGGNLLAGDPVLAATLQNDPVLAAKLQNDPVLAAKLQNDPVLAAKLQNDPLLAAKLQNTIAAKLQNDPVLAAKLQNNPALAAKLQTEPMLAAKLQDDPVLAAKLQNDPELAAKLQNTFINAAANLKEVPGLASTTATLTPATDADEGGAALRCPKCQASLRFSTDSAPLSPTSPKSMGTFLNTQSPAALRTLLESAVNSAPASGDAAGGGGIRSEVAPGISAEKRLTFGLSDGSWASQLSAEDLVGAMSDEELLFGGGLNGHDPGSPGGRLPGDEAAASMQQTAGSTYRAKVNALGGGRHQRWQALFADASERGSRGRRGRAADTSESSAEVPAGIIVTQESQNLIQHANQVHRSLWREAEQIVPGQQSRLPQSEAGPESGAGLGGMSISGSGPAGAAGLGGMSISGRGPAGGFGGASGAGGAAAMPAAQLEKMQASELRDELSKRGLDTSGSKADLAKRLAGGGAGGAAGGPGGAGLGGVSISGSPAGGAGLGGASMSGTGLGSEAARRREIGGAARALRTPGRFTNTAPSDRNDFSQGHRILERGKQDGSDVGHLSSPAISSFSAARQASQQVPGQGVQGKIRQGLGLSRTSSNPGLSPLENHLAQRKAKFSPSSPEEVAPPLFVVGSGDGVSEDPASVGSPAAIAAAAAAQPRARTAPSKVLSDAGSTIRETRAVGAALGANGLSPFSELDVPDTLKNSGSRGTLAKPQGAWRVAPVRGRHGAIEAAEDYEDLGSGLPQPPPPKNASTMKALTSSSRQQSMTKQLPKALKRGVDAVLNSCMSMPDLRLLTRHEKVGIAARTAPLASSDEKASALRKKQRSPSPEQEEKRQRSPSPEKERQADNSEAAPFETPLLYIGKPPPGDMPKRDPYGALQGAGHAVPTTPAASPQAASLRMGLARAAAVFELGSHVQTHAQADGEEEPLSPSSVKDLTSALTLSSYQ